MTERKVKTDLLSTAGGVVGAAVLANLLWGSAAPCIKLGYRFFNISGEDVMSQILFAGVRFTLAGLLTILIGSLLRGRLLLPKRGSGGMILTLAMMQTPDFLAPKLDGTLQYSCMETSMDRGALVGYSP